MGSEINDPPTSFSLNTEDVLHPPLRMNTSLYSSCQYSDSYGSDDTESWFNPGGGKKSIPSIKCAE
jgi:hypothetical protein